MRWVLWPLEMLYRLVSAVRCSCYTFGVKKTENLPVPVIVVGNVTVGGTGKTPTVIWLASELMDRGLRVGCVSRGYGGNATDSPQRVRGDSDPVEVGDEPVLIAAATGCPVMIGSDRVAAAKALLARLPSSTESGVSGTKRVCLQAHCANRPRVSMTSTRLSSTAVTGGRAQSFECGWCPIV
jgi:tetraacyldisaccharide-1-P 4'-kinase